MKKWLTVLFAISLALLLAACGGTAEEDKDSATNESETEELKKLVVGASPTPHAEILNKKAKPLLEEKGIELVVEELNDYVIPNETLASKELDANYFQHIPYLEQQIKDRGYDFVNAGGVHIEPMGIYSQKHKSLDELPDNAKVFFSSSVADHGRVLSLLETEGLITLKKGIDKVNATVDDIEENPKNLQFNDDSSPEMLGNIYKQDEGDIVIINSNYAIEAGLNPLEDSIAIESGENNPYVNIITVRNGDENKEEIKALLEVLHSKEVQDWILEEYNGSIIPVTE